MGGACVYLTGITPWHHLALHKMLETLKPCVRSWISCMRCVVYFSDGSVVSFQKTAVAVLASVVVFLKTAVAVLMRLC